MLTAGLFAVAPEANGLKVRIQVPTQTELSLQAVESHILACSAREPLLDPSSNPIIVDQPKCGPMPTLFPSSRRHSPTSIRVPVEASGRIGPLLPTVRFASIDRNQGSLALPLA